MTATAVAGRKLTDVETRILTAYGRGADVAAIPELVNAWPDTVNTVVGSLACFNRFYAREAVRRGHLLTAPAPPPPRDSPPTKPRPSVRDTQLSARELQILELLVVDGSYASIGRRLGMSRATVHGSMKRMCARMGVPASRDDAVREGLRRGHVSTSPAVAAELVDVPLIEEPAEPREVPDE